MGLNLHDLLWLIPAGMGLLNAWQNKSIKEAVLGLKVELSDRIADSEGDIKALQVMVENGSPSARPAPALRLQHRR